MNALQITMLELAQNADQRENYAKKGRLRFETLFTADQMIDNLEQILNTYQKRR